MPIISPICVRAEGGEEWRKGRGEGERGGGGGLGCEPSVATITNATAMAFNNAEDCEVTNTLSPAHTDTTG